jgi:hypothetical protein
VGDRFVPRGRGVRIPSGDTNPAVFWHPTFLAFFLVAVVSDLAGLVSDS